MSEHAHVAKIKEAVRHLFFDERLLGYDYWAEEANDHADALAAQLAEERARAGRLRAAVLANGAYAESLRQELFIKAGPHYRSEHITLLRDRADAANAACHAYGDIYDGDTDGGEA